LVDETENEDEVLTVVVVVPMFAGLIEEDTANVDGTVGEKVLVEALVVYEVVGLVKDKLRVQYNLGWHRRDKGWFGPL
jgi:hypothetical protein